MKHNPGGQKLSSKEDKRQKTKNKRQKTKGKGQKKKGKRQKTKDKRQRAKDNPSGQKLSSKEDINLLHSPLRQEINVNPNTVFIPQQWMLRSQEENTT